MSTTVFDPAQHPRGTAGKFTEKPAPDPGDILTAPSLEDWQRQAARAAYESAATAVDDRWELHEVGQDEIGIPAVFELVDGDPLRLRVWTDEDRAAIARFAVDDINTYFGPQDHTDGYEGPVVTAEVDPHDPTIVNLTVTERPGPSDCAECGDRRGWTVAPNPATGDSMQVQCRTCAERADTHIAGTRFIPATEPMGQHWHVATCSCGWEGARFDSQKNASRAANIHVQLIPDRS